MFCLWAEAVIFGNHSNAAMYTKRIPAKVDMDFLVTFHHVNTIMPLLKLPTSTDDVSHSQKW